MRLKIGLFLLLLPLFHSYGCSGERPPFVDFSKMADMPPVITKRVTIKYTYLPQYSHTVSYERHNPLIGYQKVKRAEGVWALT